MGPLTLVSPARKDSLSGHVINPLLTNLVRSRWMVIILVHFAFFHDIC